MTCSLPEGYLITTDNDDEDYFYLSGPNGHIIDHGNDATELAAAAWRLYRASK